MAGNVQHRHYRPFIFCANYPQAPCVCVVLGQPAGLRAKQAHIVQGQTCVEDLWISASSLRMRRQPFSWQWCVCVCVCVRCQTDSAHTPLALFQPNTTVTSHKHSLMDSTIAAHSLTASTNANTNSKVDGNNNNNKVNSFAFWMLNSMKQHHQSNRSNF